MKQKDAKSNNGVVGNKGRMIPSTPKLKAINPISIKRNLTIRFWMMKHPFL
jgi:hypothetical protein